MSSVQRSSEQMKLAMAETNDLFNTEVFGKRNFDALEKIYTEDAHILPPGSPMISGLQGIKHFWSSLIETANATAAVLTSIEVIAAEESAVEIGKATLTIQPEGQGKSEIEVKYVVYWQLENESWKWHIDIWNQNA